MIFYALRVQVPGKWFLSVKDLETNTGTPNAKAYHDLLTMFAYGTYEEYLSAQAQLPTFRAINALQFGRFLAKKRVYNF